MKAGNIYSSFSRGLWLANLSKMGRPKAALYRALRLLETAVREYLRGTLGLHATSFVYTTLLSIVPFIAVSFSVLKAFGAHNLAEPLMLRFLAPLGPAGAEITGRVMQFVGNMKVGVLGTLGMVFLISTVVSLVYKMETSLNLIWRVKESRSVGRRFSEYISVIVVGPILIFTAMGVTAAVKSSGVVKALASIGPIGVFYYYLGHFLPFITTCMAFVFTYMFLPNTKVRLSAGLVGGVFAGVLWEALGWLFATFVVASASYSAIYSGFAILVVFMMWMYYSWLTFLVGATVSFYFQHPEYMAAQEAGLRLSGRGREELAVSMMILVGESHYFGRPGWTRGSLAKKFYLPADDVMEITEILQGSGFLAEASAGGSRHFLPARDIETIKVKEVIEAVRRAGGEERMTREVPEAADVMGEVDEAVSGALGEKTVKDLVLVRGKEEGQRKAA